LIGVDLYAGLTLQPFDFKKGEFKGHINHRSGFFRVLALFAIIKMQGLFFATMIKKANINTHCTV